MIFLNLSACMNTQEMTNTGVELDNGFPNGVFTQEKTKSELNMQFNKDGSYIVYEEGIQVATGTYTIDGDLYLDDVDYASCKYAKTATYQWSFDGEKLKFILIGEDRCFVRHQDMDGFSWIKQE